jgi:hypothetical protein
VVNNTGHPAKGPLLEISDAAWHEGLDLLLLSLVRLARLVTPVMQRQGGGAIVNVSSFVAREPSLLDRVLRQPRHRIGIRVRTRTGRALATRQNDGVEQGEEHGRTVSERDTHPFRAPWPSDGHWRNSTTGNRPVLTHPRHPLNHADPPPAPRTDRFALLARPAAPGLRLLALDQRIRENGERLRLAPLPQRSWRRSCTTISTGASREA